MRNFLDYGLQELKDNGYFLIAIKNNDIDFVKQAIKNPNIYPYSDDSFYLRFASENDRIELVEILMRDGRVDPSSRDHEAIRAAIKNKNEQILRMLFAHERSKEIVEIIKNALKPE